MTHYIVFMTASGPCLVFVCVGKYVDIEDEIKERALHENFNDAEDVKVFMDKYISDTKRADYVPYWEFEKVIVVSPN